MKYFSFKILLICIIIPPLFHLLTVQTLETYLKDKYTTEIKNIYTGDARPLLNGSIRLKDAINNNIDRFIQHQMLTQWGVKADVLVTTKKKNIILYPSAFEEEEDVLSTPTRQQVASENFQMMKGGLNLSVDIFLERSSLLVLAIFSFYSSISLLILYRYYRLGAQKAKLEGLGFKKEIDRLKELEEEKTKRLKALGEDKQHLTDEFQRIKNKLDQDQLAANRFENEMLNEIIALEEKVKKTHDLYDEQQKENETLKDLLDEYEKERQRTNKPKARYSEFLQKRFKALYKNTLFHARATEGLADLPEEWRIKAEEIIHQLDADPSLVSVKRKVMMNRNPDAVFEVVFSHKGRLYFSKRKDKKVNVLTIGTKNTQAKDLAFLDSLEGE